MAATMVALIVGKLFARLSIHLMAAPISIHLVTDWRLLLVAAVCTLIALAAFGLAPAIQAVRRGPKATRARQLLVAVSCVLLILGSALTRGVIRRVAADLRFDFRRMMDVDPALYNHHLSPPACCASC